MMFDMESIGKLVERNTARLEAGLGKAWAPVRRRMGLSRPGYIAAYRGLATVDSCEVSGRVLASRPRSDGRDNSPETIWAGDATGAPSVSLEFGAGAQRITTDEQGYYQARLDAPARQSAGLQWLNLSVGLADRPEITATHEVILPGRCCEFLIINAIDDTVIDSRSVNGMTPAKPVTQSGVAMTRPLHGSAALLHALQHGTASQPVNPVFHLSSAPWSLYDPLLRLLEYTAVPRGPLFLQTADSSETRFTRRKGHLHKLQQTLRILETYPGKPAILIGDSGQEDAPLFAEAVRQYPHRIVCIYIRDVDAGLDSERDQRVIEAAMVASDYGVDLLPGPDAAVFASHAASIGMIESRQRATIAAAVSADRRRCTGSAAAR